MPATLYQSTDSGAPQLTATAGSLIQVLDAVLVNGYGSKSPAGWAKVFSGSNLAAYRNGDAAEARSFLRVDDTTTTYATLIGYDTMSDVNTGTHRFPPSGTAYCAKSGSTIGWYALADAKTVFFSGYTSASPPDYFSFYFGEGIKPISGTDAGNCLLIGSSSSTTNSIAVMPVLSVTPAQIPPYQSVYCRKSDAGSVLITPRNAGPLGYPGVLHTNTTSTVTRAGFLRTTQPSGVMVASFLHYFYNGGTDINDNIYGGRLRWLVVLSANPSDYVARFVDLTGVGQWSGKTLKTLGRYTQYSQSSQICSFVLLWDTTDD